VNTLLADPPAAHSSEQPPASLTPAAPPEGGPSGSDGADRSDAQAQGHVCAHCGTPLQDGQHWCLHCGACEPGSLGERPNLGPLKVLALTAAILALGAAVAVAAAIKEHNAPRSHTVALVPATTPTTPVPTTPAPAATTPTPGGTGGATAPHSTSKGSNLLFPPSSTAKPPKVTAPTPTPKAGDESKTPPSSGSGTSSTTTPSKATTTETGTSTTESKASEQPSPILLDTNAATTYNPYNYPESSFGDPALAIDGEPSTEWTAQVQPHSFPNMAEGLLIDLREPTKLGSLELRTPTPGMTVQIYGANGAKAPATITEPGWVLLSGSRTLKKKVTHLKKLRTESRSFRWVLVWLVKAPASAQGTPATPGRVALSEVALYPPAASS
jgi:hypothetical protein